MTIFIYATQDSVDQCRRLINKNRRKDIRWFRAWVIYMVASALLVSTNGLFIREQLFPDYPDAALLIFVVPALCMSMLFLSLSALRWNRIQPELHRLVPSLPSHVNSADLYVPGTELARGPQQYALVAYQPNQGTL